jgi:hypothetical protein
MSVQGVGPVGLPPWQGKPTETARRPVESEQAARPALERKPPPVAAAQPDAIRLPDSPPDGVDPELWSLLTTEERTHFSRFAAMGGVTYGPGAARPSMPPASGQRFDLRV